MTLRIDQVDDGAADWNTFARAQSGYTHFHRFEWRDVISSVFGHECIYLAARDSSGALHAVLPLVRVKSVLFGHFLVSMPFLNYGGPLGSTEGMQGVVDAAVALGRRDNVKLVELRSRQPLPVGLAASHRKITVILDLGGTPDVTFKALDAKLRSQIRRPQKAGVTVVVDHDQVGPFYSVFSHHMRDLGTPTLPRRFFEAIAAAFPGDVWFACAYLHGRAVAAGCGFVFGSEFELTWAASLREYNREAPNMLLYWTLMERAIGMGLQTFNFGRCTPGSGTHRFKMQWGGREQPLWWYQQARHENTTTPSPDAGPYSWGPRLWRHLPLRVATALGPAIVRYIP